MIHAKGNFDVTRVLTILFHHHIILDKHAVPYCLEDGM